LIMAGALDSLPGTRAQKFYAVEDALLFSARYQQNQNTRQVDIFGNVGVETIHQPELPLVEPWTKEECLAKEKEIIGFYLSGDPLDQYIDDLNEFSNVDMSSSELRNIPEEIRAGGIISDVKTRFNKRNQQWAIIQLSGKSGNAEVFVFNEVYQRFRKNIEPNKLIFVQGRQYKKSESGDTLKITAQQIIPMDRVRKEFSNNINIRFLFNFNEPNLLENIQTLTNDYRGSCRLIFHLLRSDGSPERIVSRNTSVSPAAEFLSKMRELVGQQNVWIN